METLNEGQIRSLLDAAGIDFEREYARANAAEAEIVRLKADLAAANAWKDCAAEWEELAATANARAAKAEAALAIAREALGRAKHVIATIGDPDELMGNESKRTLDCIRAALGEPDAPHG